MPDSPRRSGRRGEAAGVYALSDAESPGAEKGPDARRRGATTEAWPGHVAGRRDEATKQMGPYQRAGSAERPLRARSAMSAGTLASASNFLYTRAATSGCLAATKVWAAER